TLANQKAIAAHQDYICESWSQGFEPVKMFHHLHHLHFLWASAAMEGRRQLALEAAEKLVSELPASIVHAYGLERFYIIPYFAMARFGLWQQLVEEAIPSEEFPFQTAMHHYFRSLAFLKLGFLKKAYE